MQAIEVAGDVLQQEGRRARLTCAVALCEKGRMVLRVTLVTVHAGGPGVRDAGKARIERGAQGSDEVGQGIVEIAIFAAAEAVPRHVDVAAEMALVRIERGNGARLFGGQKLRQDGAAIAVEFGG